MVVIRRLLPWVTMAVLFLVLIVHLRRCSRCPRLLKSNVAGGTPQDGNASFAESMMDRVESLQLLEVFSQGMSYSTHAGIS